MEEEKVLDEAVQSREDEWARRLEDAYEISPEEYNRVFDQIEREKREQRAIDNPGEFNLDDILDEMEDRRKKFEETGSRRI